MLVEFRVKNFRSIKDEQVLSMVASKDKELPDNTVQVNKISLLKTAVIYGANASGKSNLLKAMDFMTFFVGDSIKFYQRGDHLPVEPFLLNSISETQPSIYEMTIFMRDIRYRYGFSISKDGVESEWLYYVPNKTEIQLFSRSKGSFLIHANLKKEAKGLEDKTRSNALFLSVLAQFNSLLVKDVIDFFSELYVVRGDIVHFLNALSNMIKSDSMHNLASSFVKFSDLQITNIRCEEEDFQQSEIPVVLKKAYDSIGEKPMKVKYKTKHKKYDENDKEIGEVEFELDYHESDGTKQIFMLIAPLFDILFRGGVLVIDELENSLHQLLVEKIIGFFYLTQNTKSQLIFTTHNTKLLSSKLFRRDQIWFTEKNEFGATQLNSLYDFSIRKDASYEKDYLAGKYGAIPYLKDINESFYGE